MKTATSSFICFFLAVLTRAIVQCEKSLNQTSTAVFPQLFKMENYYKCPYNKSVFCTASLKLIPNNYTCELWQQLEDWSAQRSHYNRTIIHRAICVPKKLDDEQSKMKFIENKANEELTKYNLSSTIYHMTCMDENPYKNLNINMYLTGLVIYLSLMLLATIYDVKVYNAKNSHTTLEKVLVCFSVLNYQKTSVTKSEDYQKLKCIQGIRAYQGILVVTGHLLISFMQKYIKNPEYVETIFSLTVMEYVLILAMVLIQVYFIISSWLLTTQILVFHELSGRFSLKDAGLFLVLRIARLWPIMAVMTFLGMPLLNYYGYGPGTFELFNMTNEACSNNWWVTFVFGTHFLKPHEVCHLGLWTISIDAQLYLIIVIFLYIVLNYRINIKKAIAFLFAISYLINALIIYEKDISRESWINLKLLTNLNFFTDEKVSYSYYGFWTNATSGALGIMFGYLYFCSRKSEKEVQPYEKCLGIISIGLPVVTVLAANVNYSRPVAALLGPLFKPVFNLGIAAGIYGISRKAIGSYIKTISEHKFAVLLGNFGFCTYIFHFFFVFTRNALSSELVEISFLGMAVPLLQDIIASFILGILATVMVEIPFVYIKKLILPPVFRKSKPSQE